MASADTCGILSLAHIVQGSWVSVTILDKFGHTVDYRVVVATVSNNSALIVRNPKINGSWVDLDTVMKFRFLDESSRVCEQNCDYVKTAMFAAGMFTVLSVKEGTVTAGIQNRSNFRVPNVLPLTIHYNYVDELTLKLQTYKTDGNMIDISYGGLKMSTSLGLQKGEKITISFETGESGRFGYIECDASVAYIIESDVVGVYNIGLKFINMAGSVRQRLERYVARQHTKHTAVVKHSN